MKKSSLFLEAGFSGYVLLFLLLSPTFLAADLIFTPPAGGTSLFPENIESHFWLAGVSDYGEKKMVAVEGVPFNQAVEMRTLKRPPNPWDFQLSEKNPTAIHKGDVLWITLWMRTAETSRESGDGFTELSMEQNSAPFEKLGLFDFAAGKQWRQFAWTCTAERDYAAGATQICLRGGYAPQVVQFGDIQVLDYGHSVKVGDLPQTKLTYPGMAADAPWRKAAAERIEKYRKGDLKVIVQDADGKPVAGATVRMVEQHPAFGFGSCVVAKLIEGTGPDSDRYREIIRKSFSKVVMENDLKWNIWDASAGDGHKTTLSALRWLQDQGIDIRGHNLVWPSWKYCPADLIKLKDDPAALDQRIEDHIKDVVGATKGQLTEWDVVNEPYANHEILDLLPPDAMATWFKLVHQLDPRPVLFLNDYAGLTGLGEDTPHKDAFEKNLLMLKEQGAPIGGLGIQAHFDQPLIGPAQVVTELDRWAKLGLEIEITEFDLSCDDEAIQAQYTRDFMTAVFSHPAVNAFLMWGFWENAHWRPKAALYRKDWSIKPNGEVWNDLVLKEWHTDLTAQTDDAGAVSRRGFLGRYQVTVTYRGKSKTWPLTLTHDGAVLAATLPSD